MPDQRVLTQIKKTREFLAALRNRRNAKILADAPPPVISNAGQLASATRLGLLRKPVLSGRAVTAKTPLGKPGLDDLLGGVSRPIAPMYPPRPPFQPDTERARINARFRSLSPEEQQAQYGGTEQPISGLGDFMERRVLQPLAKKYPIQRANVKALADIGSALTPSTKPFQDMTTAEKVLTLGTDIAASIPWGSVLSKGGRAVIKQSAQTEAMNAYNATFGKSLDAMIAKRARGIPADQFNRFQNQVYDWFAANKPGVQENATNRMLIRMGKTPMSPGGVNRAAKQAAEDTVGDIEKAMVQFLPKFTPGGSAVPGQTRPLAEIMTGVEMKLGQPAKTLSKLATPEATAQLKGLQTQATKAGFDLEAVEGIAPGEYWVSLTRAGKAEAREARFEWLSKLPKKNMPKNQLDKIGEVVEFIQTRESGKRFYPFKTLADAQRFLTSGDTSGITTSLSLRGQPMSPEKIAKTRAAMQKGTERLKQFQPLLDKIKAKQAEIDAVPEVSKDLKPRAWAKAKNERDAVLSPLRAEIGKLNQEYNLARMQPEPVPFQPPKPFRQPRAGLTEEEAETKLAAFEARMTPEEKEAFQVTVKPIPELGKTITEARAAIPKAKLPGRKGAEATPAPEIVITDAEKNALAKLFAARPYDPESVAAYRKIIDKWSPAYTKEVYDKRVEVGAIKPIIIPKAEVTPAPEVTEEAQAIIEQVRNALVATTSIDEVSVILPDGTALTGREFKGIGAFQHLAEGLPNVQRWLDAGVVRTGLETDGTFFIEIRGGLSQEQFSSLSKLMSTAKNVRVDFGYFENEITKSFEGTPNIVRGQLRELLGTPGVPIEAIPKAEAVTTAQAAQAIPETAPAVTAEAQAGKVPPAKTPPPTGKLPPPTGGTLAGQPQSGDFAGNIRLEKYPEEIRPLLKEWADANPEVIANARRGVRSDAEVLEDARMLADDVGGDFARMQSRWKAGDAWNAEEILALRGTLRAKTEAVLAAQKVASQTNSTENLLKLKLALEEQAAVQKAVSGVTAEAGRALRQFRQQVFEASTDAEKLERLLKEAGGRDKIEDLVKLLGEIDINNPAAVNAFIRALNKPGFWDYITEIYYNSILSGPKTHIVNSLSNTFNVIVSPVERGAAALVDMPLSRWQGREQARFLGEVPADAFGAISGITDGFKVFGETYKTGISPQQASKFEMQRTKAFTGIPGRVINFPSTSLEAADALMQSVNYRAAFNATAFRIVKRSGVKGSDFVEALAELKLNPTKELLAEAGRMTEERLFRAPAGKTTQTIINLREALSIGGFKPLRYIIPFIRTPANLLKYGIERSPGGWLNPKLWVNVAKKNPEAADQIGRAVLGTLAAIAIMWYVVEEKITGAAPTNSAERDRFYRDGKQPFSVKVGNHWISYQRLEPFNQTFAQVAAVYDAMKSRERDAVGKTTDALSTISQNMISQTYLSGLSGVIDALSQPEQYASRILTRFGTALVIPASSLTRTAAQMTDRTVRAPQNLGEEFKAGIPGLSRQVPSKLTAFGEDVTRKTPAWSPINISPSEETPLTRELDRLQINTGFTGKTIAGIPLTIDEQREFQIQAGQKTRELLTVLIANPAYVALSDADKEKAINATVDKARNLARVAILVKIAPAERANRLKQGLQKGIPVQASPATPPVIPRTTIPATPTSPPVPGSLEDFRQRRQELAGATR